MARNDEILAAARRLACEVGFDGLRVEDIAREVGLTGSAVYRHVGKKRDILEALFDDALDGLLVRVGHPVGSPSEQLEAIVRAHIGFAVENVELLTVYVREGRALEAASRRRLRGRESEYRRRWAAALEGARPDLPPERATALVAAAIGLVGSMAYWPDATRRHAVSSPLLETMVLRLLSGGPIHWC